MANAVRVWMLKDCVNHSISAYTVIYELPSWIKLATAHASTSLTVRSSCWQSVEILAKS